MDGCSDGYLWANKVSAEGSGHRMVEMYFQSRRYIITVPHEPGWG